MSNASAAPVPITREVKASFRNKGFVLALSLLALSALGLETITHSVGLYFKKQRVELRQDLHAIPRQLGPWLQVSKDVPLPEEQEHALGTKEYISRQYVDTRQMSGFDKARWDAMSEQTRASALSLLRQKSPQSVVQLHIAYYTGLVDTVAHVPERCYVAGGFDPVNPQVMALDAFPNTPGRKQTLKAKYSTYVDRARPDMPAANVAYLFQVNGAYEYDSIGGVRVRLQNITEKYGYYAKIELMTQLGDQPEVSRKAMSDFLAYAMPSIEKCLPDWQAVTGKPAALNNDQ